MLRQFNPQRFRYWKGRRIGTICVGTIVYIQDHVRSFTAMSQPVTRRNPWIVEAWLNRDDSLCLAGRWTTAKCAGGHLALVRSLRDGRRRTVADWILWACVHAGLERP